MASHNIFILNFLFRIQDLDGGFFERFGSLLQQTEIKHEETLLAALPQVQCSVEPDSVECAKVADNATDSGIENAGSDSETEDTVQSVDFFEDALGWNVSI